MTDVKKEITEFTAYDFTAEDYTVAVVFNEMQLKHIQTQMARYAQQKVNMSVADYSNIETYVRAQEYLRGLMDGMKYLIELHLNYREAVADLVRERNDSQRNDDAVERYMNAELNQYPEQPDENNMRGGR